MNQCGQSMEADQQISRAQDRKIQIVNKFEKPKYQNVLGLLDDPVPTPNTDQDTNISLDNAEDVTNAVPHLQENNPEAVPVSQDQNSNNEALETNATNETLNSTSENTKNVSYAVGNETEFSIANPNAVKPPDSIVFAKWGSITIDVPSTSTAKYNGTINVDISVDQRYLTVNGYF